MNLKSTFQVDIVLLEICKTRDLNIQDVVKDASQVVHIIDKFIDMHTENVIEDLIEEFKYAQIQPLSGEYQVIYMPKISPNQKESFQKISPEKRVKILNNFISIAINNANTGYQIPSAIQYQPIRNHAIMNEYTLEYFLSPHFVEESIINIEIILAKLNTLITKKMALKSNYFYLIEILFELHKVDKKLLSIFKSNDVANFVTPK